MSPYVHLALRTRNPFARQPFRVRKHKAPPPAPLIVSVSQLSVFTDDFIGMLVAAQKKTRRGAKRCRAWKLRERQKEHEKALAMLQDMNLGDGDEKEGGEREDLDTMRRREEREMDRMQREERERERERERMDAEMAGRLGGLAIGGEAAMERA